ncbi:hypothetical protein [Desulforhopalus sp. 52FAK]
MTNKAKETTDAKTGDRVGLENTSRRKAVKTIVGGVTALAAYNMMPAKWGTPIIEQVFLPAHAATSGGSIINNLAVEYRLGDSTTKNITVKVSGFVNPATAGVPVKIVLTPSKS